MEMKFDLHFTSESLFSELASGNPRIGTTLLNTFLSLEDAEAVDGLGEFGAANPKARYAVVDIKITDISSISFLGS